MKHKGTVYLVGAGPGDPALLTLRAADLLAKADVVVYDALVNKEILRLAPATAEIIFAGKRVGLHTMPQNALNGLLVEKAKQGKSVVRLKGGDPYVFGRGGEEASSLAKSKINFEVVPGVSSAEAVPNYAGIPVTHRDHCSSYTVITGHEDPTKEDIGMDWAQIARIPGTKVVLMGVTRIREIAALLVKEGMAAETPVAMVRWGTTGAQKSVSGTLATIADVAQKAAFAPPAVTIIGDVVNLRSELNWFEKRPLFGKRIVVTRSKDQASQLARRLRELSAEVLEIPTIRIAPPDNTKELADALLELNSYDWIVFTSANGVTTFFEYFFKGFEDMRDIGGVRIAAVGPATAAKLKEFHLKVDVMPKVSLSLNIAKALTDYESIENLKILLMRAQAANRELPEALEALGAIVDDIACYKTLPETEDNTGLSESLLEHGADWITFTSGSTVEHFHTRFDLSALLKKFPAIRLASIGPETSKAIEHLGLKPDVEAGVHTLDGLVEALLKG
jgi:uroporphyrinogen III methyltransferase/synthase